MGVFGLMSHCLQHRQQCAEIVDLVDVARHRGGIELLVDFYSFEHLLHDNLWKSLCSVSSNPYLPLLGGEYGALEAYITKIVMDLKSLDIHLVMYVDGAKGSSKIGTQQKLETWRSRHLKDVETSRVLLDVCRGRRRIGDLSQDCKIRPVLLEIQIFETLKKCNCEIVQLASGEADFVLARNLLSRPKAYAIVSNDSDFCIFRDCRFIPNALFDLENDLQLGASDQLLTEKPLRLMVGMIASARVAQMLDRVNRRFAEAVTRSREFYAVMVPGEEPHFKGMLSHFISEGIQKGNYPGSIMAMHFNFYWHRMLLQDCDPGRPCVEVALSDLRSYLYQMLLNREENRVVEYGRTPNEEFASGQVYCAKLQGLPPINFVQENKIFQNLRTFHNIMQHYEQGFEVKFFGRYGRKNGFLCYVLRYFMCLNAGWNLCIDLDEFMAVAATVFGRNVDERWCQGLVICPSVRCVTLGNWFQDVYRHAFQFLGKVLFLTHEFPQPYEIFSGAVWTAFYMLTKDEGSLVRSNIVSHHDAVSVRREMDSIIKEKRHMLHTIVQGVFDFNPRF